MSGIARRGAIARHPPRYLYSHSLLCRLPSEEWHWLKERAKPKLVSKGEALFGRGDGPDGCYWLRHGFVKISVASRLGRERILAVLARISQSYKPLGRA
jgi:CRP-like cAMP-binding protein